MFECHVQNIRWSKHYAPIPLETVLADFGLTMTDWETMAKTPLAERTASRTAKRVALTHQARADIRAIPQPVALQIPHTLARFLESEEGSVKRLQDHRVIFRDLGDHVEVNRVRDRKDAYR